MKNAEAGGNSYSPYYGKVLEFLSNSKVTDWAVDNKSATSARELATALRYVSAQAKDSGVSLSQLISYIGVISSTTRLNAEQIGQAIGSWHFRTNEDTLIPLFEQQLTHNK